MTIEQKRKAIIQALEEGKTLSEIGREVFHSTGTGSVNHFIEKYGIPVAKHSDRYAFMDPEWLKDKLQKYGTPSSIAKKYGVPRTSVTRYAEKHGLYTPKFSRTAKNAIDEHYFDIIDSAPKAYWLGVIMADGNIYHYKDGSQKVQFELKIKQEDQELLVKFAQAIGFPEDKISLRSRERKGTMTYSASIRSYNAIFCGSLEKYGISDRKEGSESFPRKLIPTEFHKDFVRGVWDGDGSLSHRRLYIGSLSLPLISQFSKFFANSDIMTYLEYDVTPTGKKIMYKLYISAQSWEKFGDLIYYQGCLGLKRKIEIAKNIQSTKFGE